MYRVREEQCGQWRREAYLGNCVFNDLFARQIRLVAYEQLVDTLRCISVNFLKPLLNVCERVLG